jgi:hypothetical protein
LPDQKKAMDRTRLYPIKPGCFKPGNDGTCNIHIQYCFTSEKKTLLDTVDKAAFDGPAVI